ncbi:hypothetical protein ALC60_02605, partial [Trachymyrmex zeteki]
KTPRLTKRSSTQIHHYGKATPPRKALNYNHDDNQWDDDDGRARSEENDSSTSLESDSSRAIGYGITKRKRERGGKWRRRGGRRSRKREGSAGYYVNCLGTLIRNVPKFCKLMLGNAQPNIAYSITAITVFNR